MRPSSPTPASLRRLTLSLTLGIALVVSPALGARAEANSFDALVRALESKDGVTCTSPPFMWLARLVVRLAQPEGVTDVRLATFEGSGLSRVAGDASFGQLLQRVTEDGWSPLVRVRSRRQGQMTAVHVRRDGGHLSLLVVTINRGDAVIVQASVKPETLTRWLDEPRLIASRTR